jgi:hypothetical protein
MLVSHVVLHFWPCKTANFFILHFLKVKGFKGFLPYYTFYTDEFQVSQTKKDSQSVSILETSSSSGNVENKTGENDSQPDKVQNMPPPDTVEFEVMSSTVSLQNRSFSNLL